MSDLPSEVVESMTEALGDVYGTDGDPPATFWIDGVMAQLAGLAAEGFAVVKVPEGVKVPHGARLVRVQRAWRGWLYAIEPTPKATP